jgi:hypothetical protein
VEDLRIFPENDMYKSIERLLQGKDLRSIAGSNKLVGLVHDQQNFDELFNFMNHSERKIVMRAADAIEKITIRHPEFLMPHKSQFLVILKRAGNKELKWHIAQIIPRLGLSLTELDEVWEILSQWAEDAKESIIVRVNSLQGLHELSLQYPETRTKFEQTAQNLKKEGSPAIRARIKKLL